MDEKDITIENRLKEFRKKHHLSQEDLACELGISRQSVIALETGRSLPSLPLAVSFCRFFDAAFEDIFDFERQIAQEIDQAFEDSDPKLIKIIFGHLPVGVEKPIVELAPWRPLHEGIYIDDAIDRLFEDSLITPSQITGVMPKIDVRDKKDSVIVRADLPGVDEEDINIEILDNVMTISGDKKDEKESDDEERGYYYKESHTGAFSRIFTLPSDVIGEKATAEMKNGVLIVTVPKTEPKKAAKVKIAVKK